MIEIVTVIMKCKHSLRACSECPMLFRKETTLAAHMATHIDARP